jgi:hypothetical protein
MVRRGASMRGAARRCGVSLCTVQRWVARAGGGRLDRVDFGGRMPGRRRAANRSRASVEAMVLRLRRGLKERSDLGEFGAAAIRAEMLARGAARVPSVRTIGRILLRRGALDGRRRVRRRPPPPGWHLPDVAAGRAELDSFDIVEGLVIRGGKGRRPAGVEVLNGVSLHGGLVASWPGASVTAKGVVDSLVGHWRASGLPAYAQFDNDRIFAGAHARPDTFGRVVRLCLSLGVTPVFAPPRETGFQAQVENYNGRWQAKVWARFEHDSLASVLDRSARFVAAARLRSAPRAEAAPPRRPFPRGWVMDLQALKGKVIFLRRTGPEGRVSLLGHTFDVDRDWPNRLVRAEVDLDHERVRFSALRRREPSWQPLLRTHRYRPPTWRFTE